MTLLIVIVCLIIYSIIGGVLYQYKIDRLDNQEYHYNSSKLEWSAAAVFWPITIIILFFLLFAKLGQSAIKK